MKTIYTNRLILRPYTIQDFDALHSVLSDRFTMRYWPEPFTAEQTMRRIEKSLSTYEKNGFGKFAVELKESGKLIGDCGITLVEIEGKVENNLGYIIHHDFHGNGYGTETAKACVSYAFVDLQLERLTANMTANNKASIRVAEKLGMTKEKEFFKQRDGGLLSYMYYLTK